MPQHIYLDTGVFIPVLWSRDQDREAACRSILEEVRGAVQSQGHMVILPSVVVGEIFKKYFEDVRDGEIEYGEDPGDIDLLERFYQRVSDLNATFAPVPADCRDTAGQLSNDDRDLDGNDLYLSAMAVDDPDSTHLIAFDSDIQHSTSITQVANQRYRNSERHHRLTVDNQYD